MATFTTPPDRTGATFRSQRVLPYSAEAIFDAFARAELLAQWWGPKDFTNTFECFEFKPGGRWKFVMHGPNGANYPNENVFLELQPSSRIVIRHVSAPHFVLTVTLTPEGTGSAMTWNQEFEDSAIAAQVRHIVEPANEQNLDRLTCVLARENPAS